jgi:hypothetical protein
VVIVLWERVVGTDCWWGQSHCQTPSLTAGSFAESVWFQQEHSCNRVGQTEGQRLLDDAGNIATVLLWAIRWLACLELADDLSFSLD